jgi:mevalonate kinase
MERRVIRWPESGGGLGSAAAAAVAVASPSLRIFEVMVDGNLGDFGGS